jgi:hypothetical protein
MDALRDLYFVIFLVIALGLAWYFAGGPSNSLSTDGPLLRAPWVSNNGSFSVPRVGYTPATSGGTSASTTESGSIITTITNYLGTFNEVGSPYAAYVSLEKANAASAHKDEYVTIKVNSKAPEKITITGWRIDSTATSLGVSLPQAAELPFLGTVNSQAPVSVSAGQKVYVITGRSPNGTSFRTNLCTGYFEQFQDFKPRLALNCPAPTDEAERELPTGSYTDECYDFVRTLSRCELRVNAIPISVPVACQNFVNETLTYNGCLTDHKNEPKFYGAEWYLYLNRDQELWRNRSERIRLLDENGKVVDVVTY